MTPRGGRETEIRESEIRALAAARWRRAGWLTGAMILLYFGFIALVAFRPDLLATLVAPGLSLGIGLGALVIVASFGLTWVYVRWANHHYDRAIERLRE